MILSATIYSSNNFILDTGAWYLNTNRIKSIAANAATSTYCDMWYVMRNDRRESPDLITTTSTYAATKAAITGNTDGTQTEVTVVGRSTRGKQTRTYTSRTETINVDDVIAFKVDPSSATQTILYLQEGAAFTKLTLTATAATLASTLNGWINPYYPSGVPQSLSGAGAINVTAYKTNWTTTSTDAGSLANGTHVGQMKLIQMIVDGGDGTLTPTSLSGYTTITFADAGDYALLQWSGTAWRILDLGNYADGATAPVAA